MALRICLPFAFRRSPDRLSLAQLTLGGWILTWALAPAFLAAQATVDFAEVGNLYVQHFAPEDYDAHAQNWAVAQAPDGLIYVGNGQGVLEYDGVSWRLIPVANHSTVRSLAAGAEGRVFVGAAGDLGYLAADSQGRMHYVSLLDRLAAEDQAFDDVWTVATTSDGAYFHTRGLLFRWNGRQMKTWRADTSFHTCFASGGDLYVRQRDVGLLRMENDSLALAPGGAIFRDKRVFGLVSRGEQESVVVTFQHGMFRCPAARQGTAVDRGQTDGGPTCTPFAPDSTELLVALQPYHATKTAADVLAVATLRGGVVLFDRDGRLLRVLDKTSGLRDQKIHFARADQQGGLWLALDKGLTRVEIGSPLSYWSESSGLHGNVHDMIRHQGRLYAAASQGVYRLAPGEEGDAPQFRPVPGTTRQCVSFFSTPQGLLAGCSVGLYDVERRQWIWPESDGVPTTVYTVYGSRHDPALLYLGLENGLARIRLRDGKWGDFERIRGLTHAVRSIHENAAGQLWLGTSTAGVLRIELPGSPSAAPVITRTIEASGLYDGWSEVKSVAGRLVVLSSSSEGSGLFRLDAEAGAADFVPDTTFAAFLPPGSIEELAEDGRGGLWIAAGSHSGVAHPAADGSYTWQPTALRRAAAKDIWRMRVETGGPVWLGGPHGLVRYDTRHSLDTSTDFPVRVRRVTSTSGSLEYGGGEVDLSLEFPYRDNSLRFAFAAPRYDAPEQTRYRVRIDGRDDAWSAWTGETYRDYTDLREGRYVFRVQARDVYGMISREDRFAFRILPPWWRTWWAYGGYLLLFAGVVAAAYRSAYRVQQRKLEAEQRVVRQLREVDKLKDEFLAATSHELRTPLYGITGLAESLAGGAEGEIPARARQSLDMIVSSGRRLSSLVDDILDFSKLRRASLALDRRPVDLHALADIVLTLSQPLVAGKDLELVNSVAADLPPALADENRVQQVLHNLVGNAIKFTESGRVEVTARTDGEQLRVEVADTGIGIDEEHRERIFGAFEQAESTTERRFGGTGLGLAVSRQLAELHGGELWLESTSQAGSTFAFTLPVADEPVADEEAVVELRAETAPVQVLTAEEPPIETVVSQAPRASSAAAEANGDHARILVVDDEPVNRRVLAGQLETAGYRIVLAPDGPEALRRIDEERFDLVLLDIMMPRMSGYEVCRALRQRHPAQELPVLFLTAKARQEDQVSGLAEGANDYLTKPVPRGTLLARVRTHVELLEAHRKQLAGLLPICAQCKNIRDDEGYWERIETYFAGRSDLIFSHGICPDCYKELYEEKLGPYVEGAH